MTRTDLGQVSVSLILIRETTRTVRICATFRFGCFVLSRLFEKRFYENKPTFDLGIVCISKLSANDKSEFSLD